VCVFKDMTDVGEVGSVATAGISRPNGGNVAAESACRVVSQAHNARTIGTVGGVAGCVVGGMPRGFVELNVLKRKVAAPADARSWPGWLSTVTADEHSLKCTWMTVLEMCLL